MYLFDNQLILCSPVGSSASSLSPLMYFKRFDLAFLNFKIENNNFIFASELDAHGNCGFIPVQSGIIRNKVITDKSVLSRPTSPPVQGGDEVEIHVKGRRSRQQWRYLLNLEIGFAKIKHNYKNNESYHMSQNKMTHGEKIISPENGNGPNDDLRLAEEICNFIRKLSQYE